MIIASLYHCPMDTAQIAHDMSAAIIIKKKIFAYEEDKLTTTKNESSVKFPERSLLIGCKELGIKPNDITDWVFPKPSKNISLNEFYFFFYEYLRINNFKNKKYFKNWFYKKVHFVKHHISHASLAIFSSPFKECAFLTEDGGGDLGDRRCFTFGDFKTNKINIRSQRTGYNGISLFHDYLTDSLGFSYFNNGKTSGLASYGTIREELDLKLSELLSIKKNGIHFENKRFTISRPNIDKFNINAYDRNKILKSYPSNTNILQICKNYLPVDIAATGEFVLKNTFLKHLEKLRKLTKSENLVCSGGLFQNVALNQKIINSGIFKNYHFPMANSDAGLSLGAAFYVKYIKKKIKEPKRHLTPYLGPSFNNKEVEAEIKNFKLNFDYKKDKEICKIAAKLIVKGFVVGWFQGRAEYGPRSLGNRSILADPTKINSKLKVNQLLKKRDWFMPYAPSVSFEFINKITKENFYSPYMQSAFNIKNSFKKKIPAAVHVDGTSRIHVVKKKENKLYWTLLNEVKKINGMPIILNTSFNRHGIPTISSPRQAIEHALEGCMDYLIINNYLVDVKKNRFFAKKFLKIKSELLNIRDDSYSRIKILKKNKISFNTNKYKNYLSQIKLKKNL